MTSAFARTVCPMRAPSARPAWRRVGNRPTVPDADRSAKRTGATRYDALVIRTAWLTVEAVGDAGRREDAALQGLRALLAKGPFVEVDYQAVADEQALIRSRLRVMADGDGVDLLFSCGGIGIGLRDRTPEATREVIDRELPGLAERMRSVAGVPHPTMALTRGVVGVRRGVLIVNLPSGAPIAEAALASVIDLLPEVVASVRGATP